MKKWFSLLTFLIAVFAFGNCQAQKKPHVEIKTNLGTIVVELDPTAAPKTVENFLSYVKDDFYNGTIFHRVIKGFMIQGGGFNADLTEKANPKAPIKNESEVALKAGLKNDRGTIAMARTGNPHSATSQFFINHVDNNALNFPSPDGWGYVAFGKVINGIDVIDKIANTATATRASHQNVPQAAIVIEKVTLMNKK